MLEFCNTCSSLIIDGACSNKNCGKDPLVLKKKRNKKKKV